MICYSNENNVHGMSVIDWSNRQGEHQHDVASNILDNISQSSKRYSVECSTIVIVPFHRVPSEQTQVSTHYVTHKQVNEVGSYWFIVSSGFLSATSSFYYNRGVML